MSQKRAAPVLSAFGGKTSMCFESPRSACIALTLDPSGGPTIVTKVDDATSEQEVLVPPPSPRLFPPGGHTLVDAKGPAMCREVTTPSKDAVAAYLTRTVLGLPGAERIRSIL